VLSPTVERVGEKILKMGLKFRPHEISKGANHGRGHWNYGGSMVTIWADTERYEDKLCKRCAIGGQNSCGQWD